VKTGAQTTVEYVESINGWRLTTTKTRAGFGSLGGRRTRYNSPRFIHPPH
jgi:hypothetical protein